MEEWHYCRTDFFQRKEIEHIVSERSNGLGLVLKRNWYIYLCETKMLDNHAPADTNTLTHSHICMHIDALAHSDTHTHTRAHTHTRTHTHTHTHTVNYKYHKAKN